MKKLMIAFVLMTFAAVPTAYAKKVGCGVRVHDDFKLNKKLIIGQQYDRERTFRGNVEKEFLVEIPGQSEPTYVIRYHIEKFQVAAEVLNIKTQEVKEFDLGTIHPKMAVSGLIFSNEFKMPIEPISFTDENGKPQVINQISGKCKLQEFYIGDWLPIP